MIKCALQLSGCYQMGSITYSCSRIGELVRIVLAPVRKPYRIRLLFTHRNRDFRAISVTERSCAAPISKVERHTDWIGPVPQFGAV